jgi:hypothetical protein
MWLDKASKKLMDKIRFPWARISTFIVPGLQEYQLPAVVDIRSVYVDGVLIVPTDIQTLEGHQIQSYDSSGRTGVPPAPFQGGGPTGSGGMYVPQWTIEPPQIYGSGPEATGLQSYPSPDAAQWSTGQRPRYYWRGGYIGLVPPSLSSPPLNENQEPIPNFIIDGAVIPDDIEALGAPLWYPDNCLDYLSWFIVFRGKFADDTDKTSESRNFARQELNDELERLRMWADSYRGDDVRGPKVQTNRRFWRKGRHRNRGYGAYPA